MTMSCDDTGTSGVRRFEVFTGVGRRREWPAEVKASIIAESYSGQESVSAVARRHGLAASQLFLWRRQFREELEGKGLAPLVAAPEVAAFVPAVIEPTASLDPAPPRRSRRRRRATAAAVELNVDGIAVKIARGADSGLIAAVIEALRATR